MNPLLIPLARWRRDRTYKTAAGFAAACAIVLGWRLKDAASIPPGAATWA